MCKAINAMDFVRYAGQQVAEAGTILARHQAMAHGVCRCGRALPCPIEEFHTRRRDYFRTRLAILRHPTTLAWHDPCPSPDSRRAASARQLEDVSRQLTDYLQQHSGYPQWRQP
jgi:hypothetical protein